MTIKRLPEFFREQNIPKEGREKKDQHTIPFYLNQMKGKKIAIETSTIVYKQNWAAVLRAIQTHTFIYNDGTGWSCPADDEVLEIFRRYFKSYIQKIIESGIIPVFILEGKSPKLKANTVQKRFESRTEMSEKAADNKEDLDLESFKKRLPYMYPPGSKHMNIMIDILKELKVDTLRAKHEAEGVCAYLVNNKDDPFHCDCALTDDYDIFMYGCKVVIRNLRQATAKVGNFEVTGYAFQDVLLTLGFLDSPSYTEEEYNIASKRFQLFCILCGTDYADNIGGLGPARILQIMKLNKIYTYSDACNFEPKFKEIPYNDIIETLKQNESYAVVYPESKNDDSYEDVSPQYEKPSIKILSRNDDPILQNALKYVNTGIQMNISSSGKLYIDNMTPIENPTPHYKIYTIMKNSNNQTPMELSKDNN